MAFDPRSEVGRAYLSYVENRARIWAEKYLDGREPDYRSDEVLRRYHFCNVWRELDRYSRWEIAQIRGRPLQEQIDIIVVGRLSMTPATVDLLLRGAGLDELRDHVRARQVARLPWYNSALQIRCRGGSDYATMFIEHRDAYLARRDRLAVMIATATSAQTLAADLSGILPHVGPFRAYELVTSLTYSEHLPALHESQLFHVGPGAVNGLALITGSASCGCATFEALRDQVVGALPRHMRWIPLGMQGSPHDRCAKKFTLRTLEDSLCEFRKYCALRGDKCLVASKRTYRKMDVAA